MPGKFVLRKIQLEKYVRSTSLNRRAKQRNSGNGNEGEKIELLDSLLTNTVEDKDGHEKHFQKGR